MKKPRMTRDRIEKMCRRAGMAPVVRQRIRGFDIIVADGFSSVPHVTFQKFNIERGEFPMGAYGTFWWALKSDDQGFLIAYPLFFDALHNPGLDKASKRDARVRAALDNADRFLRDHSVVVTNAARQIH